MADRNGKGQFIRGHKGFKGGGKYAQLRKMLKENEEPMLEKVISMAVGGDINAIKLCFQKLYGPGAIPEFKLHGDNAMEVSRNLLASVGMVDADTLNGAAKLLETHIKVVESQDFEKRLEALEDAKS